MSNIRTTNSNEKIKSLSEVRTIKNLISFLDIEREDDCDDYYHHFTTFSKLEKILESGNWRFTPDSKKNDMHEYQVKESLEKRNKILSVSLMRGDEDNMAMWAMYGIPWEDAIRITFTKSAVWEWRKIVKNYTKTIDNADDVKLHNIIYYHGFRDENKNNRLLIDNEIKEPIEDELFCEIQYPNELSSYIKNSAWKQEQETRLSIFFKEDYKNNLDIPFGCDFSFILKNMIIAFGPWTSKKIINKRMKRILDILSEKGIEVPHDCIENLNLMKFLNDNRNSEMDTSQNMIVPGNGLIFSPSPFIKQIELKRHCHYCPILKTKDNIKNIHDFLSVYSFWFQ